MISSLKRLPLFKVLLVFTVLGFTLFFVYRNKYEPLASQSSITSEDSVTSEETIPVFQNFEKVKLKPSTKKSSDSKVKNNTLKQPFKFQGRTYYHQTSKLDKDFFLTPPTEANVKNIQRAHQVKEAFVHAWSGYSKFAWGKDSLLPISKNSKNDWLGWGVTLVDSLDTLLLMGMDEEYEKALKVVEKIDFTKNDTPVMVFETIIRYLGGLIGAHDLKPNPMLLKKATDLANSLLPAFDKSTGFPSYSINIQSGELKDPDWLHGQSILAELGSVQLEFHRLSQLTGNPIYADAAQKIINNLDKFRPTIPGLYPLKFKRTSLESTDSSVSFGAMGDSFYEYLLKRYILTNRTEDQYRRMYVQSIESMDAHLFKQQKDNQHLLLLSGLESYGSLDNTMDHLTCFAPGMLGLGAAYLDRPKDFMLSQEMLYTCEFFYSASPTHLSPDILTWSSLSGGEGRAKTFQNVGLSVSSKKYRLRPETVESIFYAYRLTGNEEYRQWGWEIFEAIVQNCKVPGGFAELHSVLNKRNSKESTENLDDIMESFFMAETLKYLYLLFMPPSHLDLNKYVFNTEAHPFLISTAPIKLNLTTI